MKALKSTILAIAILLPLACSRQNNNLGKERATKFGDIEQEFRNPGKEFRPAPLWVWNGKVTKEDIDRSLIYFKDKGFGGAFIHPRPGLITEYLSEEWFELWKYSVEKSRELGLDMWIYDENSYPSGFAGGHVQRDMPLSYDHTTLLGFKAVDTLAKNDIDSLTIVVSWDGEKLEDITSEAGNRIGVKGTFYLIEEKRSPSARQMSCMPYVDLLYPGVADKFREVTMSGYEKAFGKELGTSIKGVFTDEPSQQDFSSAMYDAFLNDWGYDLKPYLPCLFTEVGDWKTLRFRFRSTMLRLFIERWAEPWNEYCLSHNLIWTGHYWEHTWPKLLLGIDNMAMYEYHRMPGIDMLFNGFNEHSPYENWGNIRSVKEVRSVANQMGYTRTLSESYGGGGWGMTFEDFKRHADWEYALGINFMTQHYSGITTGGVRKYDFPDFFTEYSPWAEDYKTLNDHVARLSLALSQGNQNNKILLIEPTTTAWMYYGQEYKHPKIDKIGYSFTELVTKLEHSQVEYDLGSETIIANHGKYGHGKFIIGEREYSTVIIPEHMEVILPETASILEEFASKGGRVIALSRPALVNAVYDGKLASLWDKGLDNVRFSLDGNVPENSFLTFNEIKGGNLYHHRREYDDGQILFLSNADTSEYVCGTVTIKGAGVEELDTMNGNIFKYSSSPDGKDNVKFDFSIPPSGHLLLFIPKYAKGMQGLASRIQRTESTEEIEPEGPFEVERLSDNCLLLDWCEITVDGENMGRQFVANACRNLYRYFGMDNPWEGASQYKQVFVQGDTISTGRTDVRYTFSVSGAVDRSSMKLVCERPWLWEVTLNGKTLEPIKGEHPIDSRNAAYAIGDIVKPGENSVVMHLDHMSVFAEISYAFITGDFSVRAKDGKWIITEPEPLQFGSWPTMGMPFYGWTVAYKGKYNIVDSSRAYILKLHRWKGTVCEVMVNGKKAGVIAYKPYESELSGFLKAGQNSIEVRCTGSFINLYGPHFTPRESLVKPKSWYIDADYKKASDYIFDSYGLHEPFSIVREISAETQGK